MLKRVAVYLAQKLHGWQLRHRTALVPAMIGAAMIALSLGFWMSMPTPESIGIKTETQSDLANFAARLEGHIAARLAIGEQIRHSLAAGQITDRAGFLSQTAYLHRLFDDFQAINWIDTMGFIRWVSPYEGNERAQNLDIRNHPIVGETFRRAEALGEMQITPPFMLTQGGYGFVAYVPVIRFDRITGFVNIVFRSEPLIHSAMPDWLLEKYDLTIMDGERLVFATREDLGAPRPVFRQPIDIGNQTWMISLLPLPATIRAHDSPVDELALVAMIGLSLLIAWLIHLAMTRQQRVRVTDKMLRTFIENSPAAIVIKDAEGRYIHTNSTWHDWFNPERRDIKGRTAADFFPRDYANAVRRQEQQIIRSQQMVEREYLSPRADGQTIPTLVQMFPIMDDHGNVVIVGGTLTDISAGKRTEEALRLALVKAEEASQAKSKFLATMSHELRTPLNAIIGFSDIIRGEYFGPIGNGKYIEYAHDINHSGRHLLALIDEVLDISAIELGKRELTPEPVQLDLLLSACVKAIRQRAESQGIMVTLVTGTHLPEIMADRTAMQQVFLNLLTNAVKFSHNGDKITVTARCGRRDIIVTVEDTGEGIRSEQLPLITEPFVKGHRTSDITHEGVGLGLSIVKSFVTAHHGTLNIASEVGLGTTVTVTLPKDSSRRVA
ncbi:ATP-binding protein [Sneathiella sp.]|uniref:ATP-binding protein n=1 Tax=Sneathiella sp. TaxID=1964365 RepID=UPI002FE2E2A4